MKFTHRDDIPFEVVEQLERDIREKFGKDMKVVFAGDHEDAIPEEIREQIGRHLAELEEKKLRGECEDCGARIEGFDWEKRQPDPLPDGWGYYMGPDGDVASWECPDCHAKRGGGPRFRRLP